MSTRTAIVTHTTRPAQDVTKRVCPPCAHNIPETPAARKTRLMAQAAANRLRVRELGDGLYEVPSQQKGPDGHPLRRYQVREFPGLGWLCHCPWADGGDGFAGHGLYVEGENDIALCAHIAQVIKHVERVNREVAALARRMMTRMEAQQLPLMADRRDLAMAPLPARRTPAQSYDDLFGQEG